MADSPNRVLNFESPALEPNTLEVTSFEGREYLSQLFRFDIELVSKKADIDLVAVLQAPATLQMKQSVTLAGTDKRGLQMLKIHGVLSSFEQFERGLDWVRYRAVLVPRLWRTSLNVQSQIYMDKTVPEIVEEELKNAGLTSDHFQFKTTGRTYPKREYVVQYQESDLNFIQRLCEHEGIFYYFEHGDEGEKIIFGDSPEANVPIQGDSSIPYRASYGGRKADDWFAKEIIQGLSCRMHMIPAEVVLRDYNYRNPGDALKVQQAVATDGASGTRYEYGDHYKNESEGKDYAKVRAEELKCRQKVFLGSGDARAFRAGLTFKLTEHYREDFNASYLITEVLHRGSQPVEKVTGGSGAPAYQNEFTCIPADVPFRPARTTPRPRVQGTINARVDAGGSGQYAEIDDEGRYKVKVPFDLTDRGDGGASRYIRMAQPYSGADMGMHFPLHKGTEVLLTHVNGDPDRPIIAASVPNPETGSPVKGGNQTQCVIRTGGDNQIVLEDTDGNQRIKLSSPHSSSYLHLGSSNHAGDGVVFDTAQDYIRRTGRNVVVDTLGNDHKVTKGNQSSETHGDTRSWTAGNTTSETVGNSESKVTGNSKSFVQGNSDSTVIGNSKTNVTGNTDDTFVGSKTTKISSDETTLTASTKKALTLAAEVEIKASIASSSVAGVKHESFAGGIVEASAGRKITVCSVTELETANASLKKAMSEYKVVGMPIKLDSLSDVILDGTGKIELKVGGSSIKITSGNIEIKCGGNSIKMDSSSAIFSASTISMRQASAINVNGSAIKME